MERVRNHSVAVAHLARIVARFTSMDAEYAFICGLVHDAGYAGALIALGDVPRPELRPALTPQIWRCFEELHEELGGTLINHWKMTPEVEAVVRGHHGLRISGHAHPMLAVLGIAEGIACREGFTLEPVLGDGEVLLASRELEDRERTAQAIEVLRLNAPMMKALNAEVAKVVPSLAGAKPAPKR
jgi:putative nucleotidyltransferase with HDIG domain